MTSDSAAQGGSIVANIIVIIFAIIAIIAYWKIFTKAGEPGWASIIPFYSQYTLVKIAGLNPWLFLLFFIPIVNVVFGVYVLLKLGAAFGKGVAWSIFLLVIFNFIGWLILGFGDATYTKPAPGAGL